MPITTLFFDLDGTVSNNIVGITRCLNHALEQLHLPQIADDEILPFIGPPFRESLPRAFPGIDVESALRLYRSRYGVRGWIENELYSGITEAIHTLHLQGFTIALCTSKPRVFAERIIAHFDLSRYFSGVHGPELDGRFDKKSDLLTHLLIHYNVAPHSALMIGDRNKDVEAARHAGTHSLGVLWGFGSRAELQTAGADLLISDTGQLVPAIHSFA